MNHLPDPAVLRGRVVTPHREIPDGLVVIDAERIAWVGPVGDAPAGVEVPPAPAEPTLLLPGLVDLHCHGGGGAGFPDVTTRTEVSTAVAEHLAHGTTTLVASLVTADAATLLERTALLADSAAADEIAGIHLEGPFLARGRCGAQDPDLMVAGDPVLVAEVARAARGHLVSMTVAPEVRGVLGPDGVVTELARAGALASVGHTDADEPTTAQALAEARAALEAQGGRVTRPTVTHLFNAMPGLHHRAPGPVAACLAAAARGEAVLELVADGVHLDPATARTVLELVGPDQVALVTDAMAAAGMPDGEYRLGSVQVRVAGGVARLAEGNALAGGTAHLLDVLRSVVDSGVDLVTAVRTAATTPAAVLGRPDVGALEAGRRADVLVADEGLRPRAVLRRGAWVTRPTAAEPEPGAAGREPSGPWAALVPWPRHVEPVHGPRVRFAPGERPEEILTTDPAALEPLAPDLRGTAGAYVLRVDGDGARVTAADQDGLRHGRATFDQLLLAARSSGPVDLAPVDLAPVLVADAPLLTWRGLSVDVARRFHGPRTLHEVVDVMASLKLNVLHLHLTDDQGWRIELPSRPRLTELSGRTAVGDGPTGYLTGAEYAELVEHAAARGVLVVPEIDLPGHVNAALHAYGELTPSGEAVPAYGGTEVGFSTLRAGLPATRQFLEDVLGDIAAMTPGPYVHIGGDESLVTEPDEYRALVQDAVGILHAAGKQAVAWQEAAAELGPGALVQYWKEEDGPGGVLGAAGRGVDVLLSPASRVYLDLKYDASTALGLEWAGHVELRDSYEWDPLGLVPGLPAERVRGVEAAVWTETLRTREDLFTMLLPRLAAVAEVAWTPRSARDWGLFSSRVACVARGWERSGLPFHRSPQVRW